MGISFFRFITIHAFDWQTDGKTDGRTSGWWLYCRCIPATR